MSRNVLRQPEKMTKNDEDSPRADKCFVSEFRRVMALTDAHNRGITLTVGDVNLLIDDNCERTRQWDEMNVFGKAKARCTTRVRNSVSSKSDF
jgi:hypothetical protein